MKNTLQDLNNYLFGQLEAIDDDSLNQDQLDMQIRKSEAICKVADRIIQNSEITLKAMAYMDEYGIQYHTPNLLEGGK